MRLIPFALTLSLLPLAASAQPVAPRPAAPAAKAPGGDEVGKVNFGADQSVFDDQRGVGSFSGNVTATQQGEDFILYAQEAVWNRGPNTASASKELRIETRESTIRAENLYADFNSKVFQLSGSVRITSYGENDGVAPEAAAKRREKDGRKPVRIACERLDWNYDTRQATLVGNIRIVQEDSVGTCDQIIYDEPKNAARLIGNVRFGNSKRQQFLANELLLYIDSGLVQTDAGVRVTGPVDNAADKPNVAPKPVTAFPAPAAIGTDVALPTPPPDIDKFLPKPKPKAAAPAKPATPTVEIEPTPTAPEPPQVEDSSPEVPKDTPAEAPKNE